MGKRYSVLRVMTPQAYGKYKKGNFRQGDVVRDCICSCGKDIKPGMMYALTPAHGVFCKECWAGSFIGENNR